MHCLDKIKTYAVRVEHNGKIYEGTVWKYPSSSKFYSWAFVDPKGDYPEKTTEHEIVEYLQKNWKV
jgi:hypothetical protein